MEGEVNLILPFCHRPVCSDSKMSYRAFQNPHWFGCEQGIRAVCVSKETLRKAFFVVAPLHLCYSASQSLLHPALTKSSLTLSSLDDKKKQKKCTSTLSRLHAVHVNRVAESLTNTSAVQKGRGVQRQEVLKRHREKKHQLSDGCQLAL